MTEELELGLSFHVVVDPAGAVIRVRRGRQVAEAQVARGSSESTQDFFARLGLFAQMNPRQLSGLVHRCTEARQRIAVGAARAGDTALATMGAFAREGASSAPGASSASGAPDAAGAAANPDDAAREIALSLFVTPED